MHLSLPRRRTGWIIFFQNLDRAVVSVSGSQEAWRVMDESTSDHLILPLASRQQWAVRERHQRLLTPLCQIMEAGKRAPHTQTPPRSRHGPGPCIPPCFPTAVRRWSRWSRLYGVWVPGAAQPSRWLLRTI